MPSTIRLCFTRYIYLLDGRRLPFGRVCRDIPIYVDGPHSPWERTVEQLDPARRYLDDLARHVDGATVGPVLRDLGRTMAVLHQLDTVENDDVRTRLQDMVAASARELAAVAVPDGELTFEPGVREADRTNGPVPVG